MKILIYCPFDFDLNSEKNKPIGGIESLNLGLSRELAKKNIVYLATFTKKTLNKNKIINLPINKIISKPNKYHFDVIISSNEPSIFNLFKDSKKIFWMHNSLSIEKSLRKKKFFPLVRNKINTIFVSKYLKDRTSKIYLFNKTYVIPNFLNNRFLSDKINFNRKIIFVWSVQRSKGLNETIDLWVKKIFPKFNDAKFYIFGINNLPKNYSMKELLSKNIYYYGKVTKTKLIKVYNQSLAMICLGYDETFCLNALEANSCGLPVLTFGKTALSELIKNKYNGFIVKNFNQLESQIIELIENKKNLKKQLIKNAIITSKRYNIKNIIPHWENLLK